MAEPANQNFAVPVRICASGLRPVVRNVREALRMIDRELPAELRDKPRWMFARALLEEAARTGSKHDVTTALRQFKQALGNDGFLDKVLDAPAKHHGNGAG